jgi:hypothetical protein
MRSAVSSSLELVRRFLIGAGAVAASIAVGTTAVLATRGDAPTLHRLAAPVWCGPPTPLHEELRLGRREHGNFDARALIGLNLDAANDLAVRNGCSVRVVRQDGIANTITLELLIGRINVDVQQDIVTALDASFGGPIG